jgi:hypothetical protein
VKVGNLSDLRVKSKFVEVKIEVVLNMLRLGLKFAGRISG